MAAKELIMVTAESLALVIADVGVGRQVDDNRAAAVGARLGIELFLAPVGRLFCEKTGHALCLAPLAPAPGRGKDRCVPWLEPAGFLHVLGDRNVGPANLADQHLRRPLVRRL